MAAARTARRRAAPPRQGRQAPARRRGHRRDGIRWDRLGRLAMLAVMCGVLYLYIGPTRSWIATYREAGEKREQVAELRRENAALRARRAKLQRASTMETEARKLGMVRAGEKAFIVRGLPDG